MGRVDPDDDSIRRFVIYRYAYDPDRGERRHQLVAAYDDVAEFERELDLAQDRVTGIDRREHWSGTVKEPGHDRRAHEAHVARRCIEHGARPPAGVRSDADVAAAGVDPVAPGGASTTPGSGRSPTASRFSTAGRAGDREG